LITSLVQNINTVTSSLDFPPAEEDVEKGSFWEEEFRETVNEILDRKRSSGHSRVDNYTKFCRTARAIHVADEIDDQALELAKAFLTSIRSENSEDETVLALKGKLNTILVNLSSHGIREQILTIRQL
jgi:Interferon-related developmental regulator (IFRD)